MASSTGNRLHRVFAAAACGILLAAGAPLAQAQNYPTRAVRLIVPFAPGAITDASGRFMAEGFSHRIGQPMVVENRPGASGNLGSTQVAQSDPDGYTLLLAPDSNMLISPYVFKDLAYDPVKDFIPIGKIGVTTLVLVANSASKLRTVQDVISTSKSKSGGLNYGTSGAGTNTNIIIELFKQISGANLIHVPYKGGGPAINDLLGGQIDMVSSTPASVLPHIKAGKLVAIAVSTPQRSASMPDVPTFIESGVKFSYNSWLGIFAPIKTPRPIVNKLNADMNAVVTSADSKDKLTAMGIVGTASTPDAFAAEIKHDLEQYGPLIKKMGIIVTE